MIFFLIGIILMLFFTSLYLNFDFYKRKKKFKIKMQSLAISLDEKNVQQLDFSSNIKIMETLNENMKAKNLIIRDEIYNLNFELFKIAAKNNS